MQSSNVLSTTKTWEKIAELTRTSSTATTAHINSPARFTILIGHLPGPGDANVYDIILHTTTTLLSSRTLKEITIWNNQQAAMGPIALQQCSAGKDKLRDCFKVYTLKPPCV